MTKKRTVKHGKPQIRLIPYNNFKQNFSLICLILTIKKHFSTSLLMNRYQHRDRDKNRKLFENLNAHIWLSLYDLLLRWLTKKSLYVTNQLIIWLIERILEAFSVVLTGLILFGSCVHILPPCLVVKSLMCLVLSRCVCWVELCVWHPAPGFSQLVSRSK